MKKFLAKLIVVGLCISVLPMASMCAAGAISFVMMLVYTGAVGATVSYIDSQL